MKKLVRSILLCLAVVSVVSCAYLPSRNLDPVVLVVPSRYTIVQLAFDIARLRPVTLVAYDKLGSESLIHVWNPQLQEWAKIGMDEYSAGSFVVSRPKRMYILGSESDLPEGMTGASTWCPVVKEVSPLDVVTVVNALHEDMSFSQGEWKWLAKRHGLKFKDLNYERRRYGKYGKPGSESEVSMPDGIEEMENEPVSGNVPSSLDEGNSGDASIPALVAPEDK